MSFADRAQQFHHDPRKATPAVLGVGLVGSFSACLAALVWGTVAIANTAALAIPVGRLHVGQRGAKTVVAGTQRGRRFAVTLPTDEGSFNSATLIGSIGDGVLLLLADYGSRPANPQGECGAGSKTMLRVISLRPQAHPSFEKLVDSCWNNIGSNRSI